MTKTLTTSLCLLALAACGDPKAEVVVPLAIVNVSPHDGATNIAPDAVPTVCFNREMDAATAIGALGLRAEDAPANVEGMILRAAGSAQCLSIDHDSLAADTAYVVTAAKELKSADGTPLGLEIVSRFRTAP